MSHSKTHPAQRLGARLMKHCSIASAQERLGRKPYEFLSAIVSEIGSRASRCKACIALQRIDGIESGLSLPFLFGM